MSTKSTILVVEDEADLSDLIAYNLEKAGYSTLCAKDGRKALDLATRNLPDLVVLDLMLPELPGTDVARRLRAAPATSAVPIIMLTAKSDEVDQIVGLSLGADDYMTKPFSIKILLARIEALLRRTREPSAAPRMLRLGEIELDPSTHEARIAGRLVHLTLTEFRLLACLMQAGGKVLSRAVLMAKAIGPGVTVTERTIDVHLAAIRRKLGEQGSVIRTVRGVGYRACLEPDPSEA